MLICCQSGSRFLFGAHNDNKFMKPANPYTSFIVRIWQDREPDTPCREKEWQGEVTHIQTSETHHFVSLNTLIETINQISFLSPKEIDKSPKILQINFKFNVTAAEYEQAIAPHAEAFAAIPGLSWKVWILNAAESEAGGIYLFENGSSLDAFLKSKLAEGVVNNPALSEFSIKTFDVMATETMITGGLVESAIV